MNYYIEALTSFKLSLNKVGSWWKSWVEKSLQKINDISLKDSAKHLLGAYGGCGSISDEVYFDTFYYDYEIEEDKKNELEAIYEILKALCYVMSKQIVENKEISEDYINEYFKERITKLEYSIPIEIKNYEYQQDHGYQYCDSTLNEIKLLQKELEIIPKLREMLLNNQLSNYLNSIPQIEYKRKTKTR